MAATQFSLVADVVGLSTESGNCPAISYILHTKNISNGFISDDLETPLTRWRRGYLWVSHLVSQLWCEQQMEYSFTRPQDVTQEPPHMTRGSELHLARELESEVYVNVEIQSDEDIFALKVLNLYGHLSNIQQIKVCREVPVFGWVGKLFVMGKIDEVRWRDDATSIEVSEFKTRTKPHLPGKAQQDTHKLQIMIYKVFQYYNATENFSRLDVKIE